MVVIILARQMGLSMKTMNKAHAVIINGIILKTMVLYSFEDFSVRAISDSTKAEATSCRNQAGEKKIEKT